MTQNCIFCQIINGKEALKIYEDKKTVCLLDINPISCGHCLIIPKKHFKNIFDINDDYLKDVISTSKKVSELLKQKLNATGVNILHASGKSAQQSVFHFHLHVVPRYKNDGLDTWPKSDYKEKSLKEVYQKIKK
ncbi:MAG: HIT family protein [Candidatus Heimdallarchaeaceae archaeon]